MERETEGGLVFGTGSNNREHNGLKNWKLFGSGPPEVGRCAGYFVNKKGVRLGPLSPRVWLHSEIVRKGIGDGECPCPEVEAVSDPGFGGAMLRTISLSSATSDENSLGGRVRTSLHNAFALLLRNFGLALDDFNFRGILSKEKFSTAAEFNVS
ncbi:hypothetical protein Tco_0031077 [Tanacetum coccineum]